MTFMLALLSRFRNGHWLSRVRALKKTCVFCCSEIDDATHMCPNARLFLLGVQCYLKTPEGQELIRSISGKCESSPPHVHQWESPSTFSMDRDILFQLTGQVCECGAARQYRGPMYGWSESHSANAGKALAVSTPEGSANT